MKAKARPTAARHRWRAPAAASLAGPALVLAVVLSGCTPTSPVAPTSTSSASVDSSTPIPTSSAAPAPVLVPGGKATQNLPFFDKVNQATIAANAGAKGRDFIDALVAAGFSKSDMQVTADTTTIGLKANSIQFSVKLGDTCLIGQYGADAGGYESTTSATLATGGCLIGQTRTIDW
ncbi:DUF6993 domain-containing protein [Leifsonia sp. McL0607]|uniref:DUF6993 domain-containing protein n=1 Tax=Leifsonia sp. McL0607 TaxID=3415672 RepID=UPI003CEA27C9